MAAYTLNRTREQEKDLDRGLNKDSTCICILFKISWEPLGSSIRLHQLGNELLGS